MALGLTRAMLVVYFGFILLIAFAKDFMARQITEGLTVGIAFGVLVILATWRSRGRTSSGPTACTSPRWAA